MRTSSFVLSAACVALALAGCNHRRCESGFISQGGTCVAFEDQGDRDGGVVVRPPRDAGPVDPNRDAGPPRDAGPVGPGRDGGDVTQGNAGRILIRAGAVLTMETDAVIAPGEVLVVDELISCVGGQGVCDDTNATVIETNGVIAPGFVDAHNHIAYNWMPEWMGPRLYEHHSQWQGDSAYRDYVTPYRENSSGDSFCAMVQWGEIRSLVNATTTVFGAVASRRCFRWLIRNASLSSGYNGWDADRMRSNTLGIDTVDPMDAMALAALMDAGDVTAYMIHLAEGLPGSTAYNEYTDLVGLELLRPETVIIHGTALRDQDFAAVANAGSKIVWSPSSNMALYGDTTNIDAVVQAGVSLSIAPDWTLSGSDDMLAELRFARDIAETRWPGLFTDADYLAMATIVPAAQMGVHQHIGTLEVGKYADLVVYDVDPNTPYDGVIRARPNDIGLVLLNGVPSFGEPSFLGSLAETPDDCYTLDACGATKQACWAAPEDGGQVSPDSVAAAISTFYTPGPQDLFDCR